MSSNEQSPRDDHAVLAESDFPTPFWVDEDIPVVGLDPRERSQHLRRRTVTLIAVVIVLSLSIGLLVTARGAVPRLLLVAASLIWATTLAVVVYKMVRLSRTATRAV